MKGSDWVDGAHSPATQSQSSRIGAGVIAIVNQSFRGVNGCALSLAPPAVTLESCNEGEFT